MKILFIHTKYLHSAGGEDTTVEAELELMQSYGHEVKLVQFDNATMGSGTFGKIQAGASSIYNFQSAKKVKEEIRAFKPDIIHVHNFFFTASPSVIIQAYKEKVPVIVTLHNFRLLCASALLLRDNKICELCINNDFPWHGVKYKCYHNSALQSAVVGGMSAVHKWIGTWRNKVDMFISPASFSRKKILQSSLGVAANKIKVKHNFVKDPGIGAPGKRKNYYLFVGRLSSEKGVDVLLKAWENLKEHRLVIAGDGPEKESLMAQYGHFENISFVGKISRQQVFELMQTCKALVFPSVCYEGLPLTIAEAFATGTPVIGSSLGAMQEMIIPEKNGLLFEPGNPQSLAGTVLLFEKYTQGENDEMYYNARNSYIEYYSPHKCYEQIMEIYNLVIKQKQDA